MTVLDPLCQLSTIELDALREVGTIGAGHAATALSQLLKTGVNMTVPRVNVTPLSSVPEMVGGSETPIVGVFLRVFGDVPGSVLFVFSRPSANKLVDLATCRPAGTTRELDDFDKSAVKEIVNILTSAYLGALSSLANVAILPSVPALAVDMAGAVLSTVLSEFGQTGDYALVIETQLSLTKEDLQGHFFLVPDPSSLGVLLGALGVSKGCNR